MPIIVNTNTDYENFTLPPDVSEPSKKITFLIPIIIVLIIVLVFIFILYKKYYKKTIATVGLPSTNDPLLPTDVLVESNEKDDVLVENNEKEIDSNHLESIRKIGEGYSAEVYLMIYKQNGKSPIEVAVKNTQNIRFGTDDVMREIKLISDCQHQNIVSFIGYFKDQQFGSLNLVMEYMPGGNLHKYLSNNLMLDITHKIVKITDFGLSRKCNIDYDYFSQNAMNNLPPRWTAIEILRDQNKFSNKSDVWSFGVVMWEIFMKGEVPYGGMHLEEIKTFLCKGQRLKKSYDAPEELYTIMTECWEAIPDDRPQFGTLKMEINAVIEKLQTPASKNSNLEYEKPRPTNGNPYVSGALQK